MTLGFYFRNIRIFTRDTEYANSDTHRNTQVNVNIYVRPELLH